eukprot:8046166-Ditylum_brightwellii.AAC.1
MGCLSALIAAFKLHPDDAPVSFRSELDNHANMIIAGHACVIFNTTSQKCTVKSFVKDAGQLDNVPIVDVVMAYGCPYKAKTYLLLMRNALYVPELTTNLLPLFILCEGRILVDECPKFQVQSPSIGNHLMYCKDTDLCTHFELNNTVSSFHARPPSDEEMQSCNKILITPDSSL